MIGLRRRRRRRRRRRKRWLIRQSSECHRVLVLCGAEETDICLFHSCHQAHLTATEREHADDFVLGVAAKVLEELSGAAFVVLEVACLDTVREKLRQHSRRHERYLTAEF